MGERVGEDFDPPPLATVGSGEFARVLSAQSPILEQRAVAQSAVLARQSRRKMECVRFRTFCYPHRSVKTGAVQNLRAARTGRTSLVQKVMEKAMTMATTCGTGALIRSDVVACLTHLRAFAIMLVGDRWRADALVRETMEQTFTAVNRPPSGVDLKVRTFAVLHGLHYGALRSSTEGSASRREFPSTNKHDLEFRRTPPHFWRPPRRAAGSVDPDDRERPVLPAGGRGMRMPNRRDQKPGLRGVARTIAGFGFDMTGDIGPLSSVGIFRACRNRSPPAIVAGYRPRADAVVSRSLQNVAVWVDESGTGEVIR